MATSITGQGLQVYQAPDSSLSNTSKNSVQNKVVANAIGDLAELRTKTKSNLVGAVNDIALSSGAGVDMNDYAPVIKENIDTNNPILVTIGAEGRPITPFEVTITPDQRGSGTPSQQNVRPIYGWTDGSIINMNVSIDEYYEAVARSGDGVPSPESPNPVVPNLSVELDDGTMYPLYVGYLWYASGGAYDGTTGGSLRPGLYLEEFLRKRKIRDYEWTMPSESIFCCTVQRTCGGGYVPLDSCDIYETIICYNTEANLLANLPNNKLSGFINSNKRYIKDTRYTTIEEFLDGVGDEWFYERCLYSGYYRLTLSEWIRAINSVGFENKYYVREIDWSETVGVIYGGRMSVDESGHVTVVSDWAKIDSYAGEELPGEWISSIDTYAEGTSPTVGAQVAYKLPDEDAQTYEFNIEPLQSYYGVNNLFTYCAGHYSYDMSLDTEKYITTRGYITRADVAQQYVAGVVKVNGNGLQMEKSYSTAQPDVIRILKATDAQVKAGTDNYAPIVPSNQKNSVFYGLAAAAGDTTQKSSNNAVGTYTDTAKTKIKTMIGIDGGRVEVLTPSETTLTLKPVPTTYKWGEVAALTLTVTADSEYHFMFTCPSGSITVLNTPGITGYMGDDLAAGGTYEVDIWAGIRNIREIEVTPV